MEKRKYLLSVIEYMTLIIVFILVDSNKLFVFTLCYLFYKLLGSIYNIIDVKDSILKYKNGDSAFRNKGYIYSIVIILGYGILGVGLSFILSMLIGIDRIFIPLIVSSIVSIIRPILDITYSLLYIYNKKKLASVIHYIYCGIDSGLIIVMCLIFSKFKISMFFLASILFIPKIISLLIVIGLCLVICFKRCNNKYKLLEFKGVVKDFNRSISLIDCSKYGYFYISFIILYSVLVNRYGYDIDSVYDTLVIGYFGCLNIILLVVNSIKYFTNCGGREYSLGSKIIYLFDRGISLVIFMIVMAKYIYMVLFGNSYGYGILMSFSLLVLFILFYDIIGVEYLKIKDNIIKYLLVGIGTMTITMVPLIDSFYRMGYNLINGSVISIIIGMSITLIILIFKIRVLDRKIINKYFEKVVMIIYQNIILSFILVILQLVINFDNNRIFSLLVIVIYIGIMIGYFRIKKRGIKYG